VGLIAEGAHVYVCGDAKHMAKDVERALIDVIASYGVRSSTSVAFIADLKKPVAISRTCTDGER